MTLHVTSAATGQGRARRRNTRHACAVCDGDAAFLRSARPPYEALRPRVRVVDLFSGCGGLTLGAAEAARRLGLGTDVRLAVDIDPTATAVYRANMPEANVLRASIEDLFDGRAGEPPTVVETALQHRVGPVDILVGGPPCQGHSDLNNHTRRADSRNALYSKMARAAEVLRPIIVLVENVPTVTHDVARVAQSTVKRLSDGGFAVAEKVIDIARLGAPQRRRRHVILASRDSRVDVESLVKQLGQRCEAHPVRSVEWAIGDLVAEKSAEIFDTTGTPSIENASRIAWLFDQEMYDLPNDLRPRCHRSDHSYVSMYGRLSWQGPAQTVTTGFGSMGQGRYVHPSKPRTITPHEAARLQMLPDFWSFSCVARRGALAELIGNAVPPILATCLLEPTLRALGLAPAVAFPAERTGHGSARSCRRSARKRHRADTPAPSSPEARARMLAVRQTGTAAELALRSEIDRLGLAYGVDERVPEARFRADLLFEEARVVVLVDGCYWHGCPIHGTSPKANAKWWQDKLAANRERDESADRRLHELGWLVLRFWEHDDPGASAKAVETVVNTRVRDARAAAQPEARPVDNERSADG